MQLHTHGKLSVFPLDYTYVANEWFNQQSVFPRPRCRARPFRISTKKLVLSTVRCLLSRDHKAKDRPPPRPCPNTPPQRPDPVCPRPEGTSLRYRLNWGAGGKRIEQAPEYSVFVGDLSPEVTDADLKQTFENKPYSSVLGAKVVTNPMTGSSKSFGFIRFGDEQERDDALTSMNGAECCGRPIRVAPATKRTSVQGTPFAIYYTFFCGFVV